MPRRSPGSRGADAATPRERALRQVRAVLEARGATRQPIVAAVSGGADSVALLRLLTDLREPLELTLVVAHLDHGLRPESSEDAAWVGRLAATLNCEAIIERPLTPPPATGLEAWGRGERCRFLARLARDFAAAFVVIAHTADDQAETVLHHVLRGTGLAGLRGMPVQRKLDRDVRLLRPGLGLRRAELRDVLAELEQPFREDASNRDPRWTRNSLRNELLPLLEARYNVRIVEKLLGLSRQAAEALRVVRRDARRMLRRGVVDATPNSVRLRIGAFQDGDPASVREAAVLLWRSQAWPRGRMAHRHWMAAAALLRGEGPARVEWPEGLVGLRRGGMTVLSHAGGAGQAPRGSPS
ncbi:MAG: tRNA lysidine(34) synthetase TilS [Planctomyces sp.]|nr:tRNA lysidine(34) synthetase TilS [Planctomyces sp.]